MPFALEHNTGSVLDRIGIQQKHVGAFSFLERAGLRDRPEILMRVSGRGGEYRVIRQPGVGKGLHLAMLAETVQPEKLGRVRTDHELSARVVNRLDKFVAELHPTGAFFERYRVEKFVILVKIQPLLLTFRWIEFEVGLGTDRFLTSRQAEGVLHEVLRRIDVRIRRYRLSRNIGDLTFVDVIKALPVFGIVNVKVRDR